MAVKNPQKDIFVIIDGNALIHRAFHAIPPLVTKDGRMINAAYGFTTILLRVMKELKPKYIATTFDLAAPTFRHEAYVDYKAHREKQADELYEQIPIVKDIVKTFNIPIYELEGFEADDLIGTIATKLVDQKEIDTYIVTGDMDILQLVNDSTFVYAPKRSISDVFIYDIAGVRDKYDGLDPDQLVDYKALRGDPSDNIPGVAGIGEKTAIELLKEFQTLDQLYAGFAQSDNIKPRIKNLLVEYKDDAYLSQKLAQIKLDASIMFSLNSAEFIGVDHVSVVKLFQDLEFKSLLNKVLELEKLLNVSPVSLVHDAKDQNNIKNSGYKLIADEKSLAELIKKINEQSEVAFDTETSGLNPWESDLLGISLSWKKEEGYFIHWPAVKNSELVQDLKKFFISNTILKIAHNSKFDIEVLLHAGIDVTAPIYDTMLAAYILHPGERGLKLDNLVFSEFGHQMIPIEDLIGKKGKDQLTMLDVPLHQLCEYACEDADYTYRLYKNLIKEIKTEQFEKLLADIELPLIPVLVEMEKNGVKIDAEFLKNFNKELVKKIKDIKTEIYDIAGEEFNIASPKQLKIVLFETLNIPTEGLKRTKTGVSTAASELEKMRGLHPIIDMITDFREFSKLKSTYVEALPKLINQTTGRVHTSFNQTIAVTGRLSSSDPNLQNIPIRTELGRKIREAFITEPGNVLLTADYSQIELRVVAHLSGDKRMIDTFATGGDIHTTTASFIFDVPLNEVTKDMRRKAKEVNFGVLYGMGAYGLSQRTGISRSDAKDFIDKYFDQYPKMKKYTQSLIEQAQNQGYVETMFGRRRYLPDIHSSMAQVRSAAERAAVNLPVQGTSADIMKLAMISLHSKLLGKYPTVKLLMQVHDELVLEVPEVQLKTVAELVRQQMQNIVKLSIPLDVDVKSGLNWNDMKSI